ncbi:MAG: response regulator [Prochloraceae cyanobacterium]
MKTLSEEQKQIIRAEFYQNWRTCSEEMVKREKRSTVTSTRQPVLFALREVLKNVGLSEKIDYRPHQDVHKLVNQLDLKCATCGRKLDAYSEVGKYLGDEQFWQSLSQNLKAKKLQLKYSTIDSPPKTTEINLREASEVFAQSAVPPQPLIACIEDSPQCLKVMEQILKPKGYQFIGIQDSLRALPEIILSKPDLIFLDIGMPWLNGYEICSKLRQASQLKNTPVIMLTAQDALLDRARARIVGASGFLVKPINVSQVINIVEKFLPLPDRLGRHIA